MKKSLRNTILTIVTAVALTMGLVGFVPMPAPVTYFVSTTGNNNNDGTTSPFRTIQHCADVAPLGSTCMVSAGTYNESITARKEGVTFVAQGKVYITRFVAAANNITVEGFHSINNPSNSGGFEGLANGITFKTNIAEKSCMAGFIQRGNNGLLEGNEIFGSRQCGGSGPDADGIRIFGDGHVVRNNYVHDISKAENPTAHIDCIQNWGTLLNTTIEGNICNVTDAGIQTDVGNVHNIIIRNNVFTGARPLNMRGEGLKITNNVFIGNATSSFVLLQQSSNVTFQNNIVYNTSDGFLTDVGTVIAGGYNVFHNASGKAPRRDSGYNYVSGKLAWTTDKWQAINGDPMITANYKTGNTALCYVGLGCSVSTATTPPTVTASASVTPSSTSTSTATVTSSNTPTMTPTKTYTPTFTPTWTASATITPSSTATSTPSPTITPTPTCAPELIYTSPDGTVKIYACEQ